MKNKTRKHTSEFAIAYDINEISMIHSSQLLSKDNSTTPNEIENHHIYVISKMPSFSFVENTLEYNNGILSVDIKYKTSCTTKVLKYKNEFPLLDNAVKLKMSEYPHKEIVTLDENDNEVRYLPAYMIGFALGIENKIDEIIKMEVLYIGQAYADGKRNAIDRLRQHSTLQNILSDSHYNVPDSDVIIFTLAFNQPFILSNINGCVSAKNTSSRNDGERFATIMTNPTTLQQDISLVEAGLIRYFQPKYNKIYTQKFPSSNHTVLQSCYNLDITGLTIQLISEHLGICFYSKKKESNFMHFIQIDLVNEQQRHGFYHFALQDDDEYTNPDVII